MSLAYPVARTLEEALRPDCPAARTLREAITTGGGHAVSGLETSWLHLASDEAEALYQRTNPGGAAGHVQRYEDTHGQLVLAISWWKISGQAAPAKHSGRSGSAGEDHTDDLYFRHGRTKKRRRQPPDPAQRDLFEPDEDNR